MRPKRGAIEKVASNKNQHFVPRCHFKPFTLQGEGRAIQVANLDRMKTIQDAPVRSQCSGDYFYGWDPQLELEIQSVEKSYSICIQKIRNECIVESNDEAALRRFMLLQYFRTEAAATRAYESTQTIMSAAGGAIDEVPSTLREALRETIILSMKNFAHHRRAIDDLRFVLIKNRTGVPFFTSDDPSICTNRWYIQKLIKQDLAFGLNNAGAIMLMPLSPDACCVLYDKDVYSLQRARGCWLDVYDPRDIDALNEHQIINCAANVYFHEWSTRNKVLLDISICKARRPLCRHQVNYAIKVSDCNELIKFKVVPKSEADKCSNVLVHVMAVQPKPKTWPSFLRFRLDGKAYSNGTGEGYVRQRYAKASSEGTSYRKTRV